VRYVLDASVAVRWFVAGEEHPHADAVLERLLEAPELFAVPELFFYEVHAVLARVHPGFPAVYTEGFLPVTQAGPLRYPMTEAIAVQAAAFSVLGLTGYDAVYAAVARELGGKWLTFDTKAHDAIRREGVSLDLARELPDLRAG
jgi:predicted nucleic acid-binding protein